MSSANGRAALFNIVVLHTNTVHQLKLINNRGLIHTLCYTTMYTCMYVLCILCNQKIPVLYGCAIMIF